MLGCNRDRGNGIDDVVVVVDDEADVVVVVVDVDEVVAKVDEFDCVDDLRDATRANVAINELEIDDVVEVEVDVDDEA